MVAAVLTALPEHFLAKLSYYWRRSSRLSRSETLVLLTAKLSALPERNSRTTDGEALGSPGAKLSYYWRRSSRLSRSETLVLTAKLPERSLTWRRSSLSPADGDGNSRSSSLTPWTIFFQQTGTVVSLDQTIWKICRGVRTSRQRGRSKAEYTDLLYGRWSGRHSEIIHICWWRIWRVLWDSQGEVWQSLHPKKECHLWTCTV